MKCTKKKKSENHTKVDKCVKNITLLRDDSKSPYDPFV